MDRALIQPVISPTCAGDPLEHHGYIREQVKLHPDRFAGCFVANPLLEISRTAKVMRELVRTGDFKAVKSHPTNHGYMPFKSRDRLDPLLEEVAGLGVPTRRTTCRSCGSSRTEARSIVGRRTGTSTSCTWRWRTSTTHGRRRKSADERDL